MSASTQGIRKVGEEEIKQRLAAILAADVAGYTRLMAENESATIAALNDSRAVFRTHTESNSGRVVDMAGDSVLAVFSSAIGAIKAAVDAQEELAVRNKEVPEDHRMWFRVGVNLGDIREASDGTVYGDGVNVAARLESLAEPGGVMISEFAYQQVRRNADMTFADAGLHEVKNVADPVRSYRLVGSNDVAPTLAAPALPDKPSIAVSAIKVFGRSEDLEEFSVGLSAELGTLLSHIRWINLMDGYDGERDRATSVAFLLSGSIRASGERLRVQFQIKKEGRLVSNLQVDAQLADPFATQEELANEIASRVEAAVLTYERDRVLANKRERDTAWGNFILGYAEAAKNDLSTFPQAKSFLERSVALDPSLSKAFGELSFISFMMAHIIEPDGFEQHIDECTRYAEQCLAIDPEDIYGHSMMILAYNVMGRMEDADAIATQILRVAPNHRMALAMYGCMRIFDEDYDNGINYMDRAIRTSSREPMLCWFMTWQAIAHYGKKDFDSSLAVARDCTLRFPGFYGGHRYQGLSLAQLGRTEEARAFLEESFRISEMGMPNSPKPKFFSTTFWELVLDGLAKAGFSKSR